MTGEDTDTSLLVNEEGQLLDRKSLRHVHGRTSDFPALAQDCVASTSDGRYYLLDHYWLASGPWLTHLGVLLVGRALDRARLGSASVIQALKYDQEGIRVAKHVWDDHTLSPVELLDTVWASPIPSTTQTTSTCRSAHR
jgi:hypothetical protein